jgi:hypothetical protein
MNPYCPFSLSTEYRKEGKNVWEYLTTAPQSPNLAYYPWGIPSALSWRPQAPGEGLEDISWLDSYYQASVYATPTEVASQPPEDVPKEPGYSTRSSRKVVSKRFGELNACRKRHRGIKKCHRAISDKKRPDINGFVNYDASDRDMIMTAVAPSGNSGVRRRSPLSARQIN